ncbi:MAG: OmpH family outer membrane protein [Verrucomicrobia bacterium]|nr:OmpH family outer membrane protein [Verrucomicrobiota bacterium]
MKKTLSWAAAGLFAATFGFVGQVKAELKVGTIDMQRVFTAYYKTREVEEKLNDAQKAAKEELDQRMELYKKNLDAINKLNEEMNKPELSTASKDQKGQERDAKIAETKGMEKEIAEFRSTREKQLQEQWNRMRQGLIEEIMRVVNDQVRAQNFDVVFDKSGQSLNAGVPVLVYAREGMDFSESVISKLNANRPAPSPAGQRSSAQPSGTNTPATTTKAGGFPSPTGSKRP